MFFIRRSEDRGASDHGWLKAKFSFSFADYYDPRFMGFGPLRVINDDLIAGNMGFGSHPHQDMEILTYIVKGALAHKDSMGNTETIRPGELQRMTAGTGVVHSEFNPDSIETRSLQIWIMPNEKGLKPGYEQKSFAEKFKAQPLTLVASNDGREGSLKIHQDVNLFAGHLKKDQVVPFKTGGQRRAWLQVIDGDVHAGDADLHTGDALAITNEPSLQFKAGAAGCHFLIFDITGKD